MEKDKELNSEDTMKVFEKDDLFSTVRALQIIQSPTNPAWIKTRGKGKNALDYVSGDTVTRMLNKAFNYKWSFQVLDTRVVPSVDKVYKDFKTNKETVTPQNPVVQVLGRLTVPGWGIREQWGSQPLQGGADVQEHAFKSAATDAMKKCASMFGVFLDLYGADGVNELKVVPGDMLANDDAFFERFKNAEKEATKEEPKTKEPEAPTPAQQPTTEPAPVQQTKELPAELEKLKEATKTQNTTEQAPKELTSVQKESTKTPSSYWSKEDIEALKAEKDRLGLADNEGLNVYTQEFFNNEQSTYQQINPNNVKDFLLFLSTK